MEPEQRPQNRPEKSIRYGNLEAAIWRNTTDDGDFLNTTITRHYRDKEDWKKTDSFREKDLPALAKLALDIHTAIQVLKLQAESENQDQD